MSLSGSQLTRLSIGWIGRAYAAFTSKGIPPVTSPTTITADADHITADSECITADGSSVCAPTSPPKANTKRAQSIVISAETKNIIAKIMRGYPVIIDVKNIDKGISIEVGIERENIVIGVENV